MGMSSIFWREAWKYGERAFRYCQHDVGHALGTIRFAAAALGWKIRLLDCVGSAAVSQLLGLDREADYPSAEREHPELVALVVRKKWASDRDLCLSNELVSQVAANSQWYGMANVLSPEHGVDWPVIDQVAPPQRISPIRIRGPLLPSTGLCLLFFTARIGLTQSPTPPSPQMASVETA